MIVTIDGPAGAGKSHVARALAQRLGFQFLDTGATYRAVTLSAIRDAIDWQDEDALLAFAQSLTIELSGPRVLVNQEDVTDGIRSPEVTEYIHYVADHPEIRAMLGQLQRDIASRGNYVTEGRDQGTVVFPDAEIKFYLTASAQERARRRQRQHQSRGEDVSFSDLLAQQNERDRRDQSRRFGRLMKAEDAVEMVTDGLGVEQVVDRLEHLVQSRLAPLDVKHRPSS